MKNIRGSFAMRRSGCILLFVSIILGFTACKGKSEQKLPSVGMPSEEHSERNTDSVSSANGLWRDMNDVKDKRIGVLLSSVQDEYVAQNYPNAKLVRIDLNPDLIKALKTEQCDVIVLASAEVREAMKNDTSFAILHPDIYTVEFGIGFRDATLRDRFNVYMAEAHTSGLFDEIEERWIENTDSASMPSFDFPVNKEPIVVGTTGENPPFTFIKNDVVSGFDIELVTRFALKEGRSVKFETMTFGRLIPSLISGQIDILASSAMMTLERRRQVAFSDPYYTVGSTVVVLKKNLDPGVKHDIRKIRVKKTETKQEEPGFFSRLKERFL
ncbi:transporter substrate-binding domain-containing protein [Odoribacter sp. OttesenSCG-928-J03]|nr:transporter substrate-binding domain-containing protein [Odoribacter sp. OttesenSCG-928-J03]MDL2283108.1 transporter substrate-binding domain-containing protein [Odoribacter sp. OttesenSCG-928-G04]